MEMAARCGHAIQAPETTSSVRPRGRGQETLNLTCSNGRENSEPTPSSSGRSSTEDLRFQAWRHDEGVVARLSAPRIAEASSAPFRARGRAKPSASSRRRGTSGRAQTKARLQTCVIEGWHRDKHDGTAAKAMRC